MREIELAISDAIGISIKFTSSCSVSGGCICDSRIVDTDLAGSFFVKLNQPEHSPTGLATKHRNESQASMFEMESYGLNEIRETKTFRVPKVIVVGGAESKRDFLVLEKIETGSKPLGFDEEFGRRLAMMHRAETSEWFGLSADNFIGSNRQPNMPTDNWVDFWIDQRIGYQFKLAFNNGFGDELRPYLSKLNSFNRHTEQLLSVGDERPALIHGDLWSGNYLVDQDGKPVLIDPAVYFANREAELGMATLFGGFDERFYQAYIEAWPLHPGWEERVEIYRLYHILNHLNLFGSSYLSSSLEIIKKYV